MSDLTLYEINQRLLLAADAVRDALAEYQASSAEWVEAERDHRHARAVGRLRLKSKLVGDREDELHLLTEEAWARAEAAKVSRDSSKEALRATQAILSGLQSAAGAHREEARLAHYGPSEGVA